jgi:hypothetical protein
MSDQPEALTTTSPQIQQLSPKAAVTNRQVLHGRPTRVDSCLSSVIVPVKGLLNTSDIA